MQGFRETQPILLSYEKCKDNEQALGSGTCGYSRKKKKNRYVWVFPKVFREGDVNILNTSVRRLTIQGFRIRLMDWAWCGMDV